MTDSNTTHNTSASPKRLNYAKQISSANRPLVAKKELEVMEEVDSHTRDTRVRTMLRKSQHGDGEEVFHDDMETVVDQAKNKIAAPESAKNKASIRKSSRLESKQAVTTVAPKAAPTTDQLLALPSLRQRFSSLLPPHMSLPIGYRQQLLLQKASCMDRSINFTSEHRNKKTIFFEDLRKNIFECLQTNIQVEDLQRVVFVAPGFYLLSWEKSERLKRHDLVLRIPQKEQEETRKCNLRKAIVEYIMRLHEQWLEAREIEEVLPKNSWHKDFDVEQIQIPLGKLPQHPQDRHLSVKDLTPLQLSTISNEHVKRTLQQTISESKSVSIGQKFSAATFLSQKKLVGDISNKIYEIVRQKQLKLKEQQAKKQSLPKVEEQLLLSIMEELASAYISKSVSNMFEVTLLELIRKRFNTIPIDVIKEAIGLIKKLPDTFLTEVAHPKGTILKVEKAKYNAVLDQVKKRFAKQATS